MTYFHVVIEIGQNFQIDISPISTWAGALKIVAMEDICSDLTDQENM